MWVHGPFDAPPVNARSVVMIMSPLAAVSQPDAFLALVAWLEPFVSGWAVCSATWLIEVCIAAFPMFRMVSFSGISGHLSGGRVRVGDGVAAAGRDRRGEVGQLD